MTTPPPENYQDLPDVEPSEPELEFEDDPDENDPEKFEDFPDNEPEFRQTGDEDRNRTEHRDPNEAQPQDGEDQVEDDEVPDEVQDEWDARGGW